MIQNRKSDHIHINLEKDVQFPNLTTGLENVRFIHQALPELDLGDIDTGMTLFGKVLKSPILVSSMTGGTEEARFINHNLAIAAQESGFAMGVGSQRAAIEDPRLENTFTVRDAAPDILLFANLGAIQLNYGYGINECRRAVDMIEADALILHLNPLQEAIQPEGERKWSGLLSKIEKICRSLSIPVIAKEVGWGIAPQTAADLVNAGVTMIDIAGAGGTSWSKVEQYRAQSQTAARVAAAFSDWGLTTLESLLLIRRSHPEIPLIASGGLRSGIDVAKVIALGASLAGLAGPLLKAAAVSAEETIEKTKELAQVLRIAMFAAGARDISQLMETPLIVPKINIPDQPQLHSQEDSS